MPPRWLVSPREDAGSMVWPIGWDVKEDGCSMLNAGYWMLGSCSFRALSRVSRALWVSEARLGGSLALPAHLCPSVFICGSELVVPGFGFRVSGSVHLASDPLPVAVPLCCLCFPLLPLRETPSGAEPRGGKWQGTEGQSQKATGKGQKAKVGRQRRGGGAWCHKCREDRRLWLRAGLGRTATGAEGAEG